MYVFQQDTDSENIYVHGPWLLWLLVLQNLNKIIFLQFWGIVFKCPIWSLWQYPECFLTCSVHTVQIQRLSLFLSFLKFIFQFLSSLLASSFFSYVQLIIEKNILVLAPCVFCLLPNYLATFWNKILAWWKLCWVPEKKIFLIMKA